MIQMARKAYPFDLHSIYTQNWHGLKTKAALGENALGAMQRVIIITPTWASNKDIFAPLNLKEEDVIEPSKTALATVVSRVEQEKKEHDEYLAKKAQV